MASIEERAGNPTLKIDAVSINLPPWRKAEFDHAKHVSVPCAACHETPQIGKKEIALPPIETCLICHDKPQSNTKVSSTCTSCHVYHPRQRLAESRP